MTLWLVPGWMRPLLSCLGIIEFAIFDLRFCYFRFEISNRKSPSVASLEVDANDLSGLYFRARLRRLPQRSALAASL